MVLYEDSTASISQVKGGLIKEDPTNHIFTKAIMNQIRSNDDLVDLFTKTLLKTTFKKLVHQNGMW